MKCQSTKYRYQYWHLTEGFVHHKSTVLRPITKKSVLKSPITKTKKKQKQTNKQKTTKTVLKSFMNGGTSIIYMFFFIYSFLVSRIGTMTLCSARNMEHISQQGNTCTIVPEGIVRLWSHSKAYGEQRRSQNKLEQVDFKATLMGKYIDYRLVARPRTGQCP